MSKRNTQQRRHLIVKMVQEQGEVSVDSLAHFFETSEVTIRKDLTALEESGFLLRRYGGAVRIPSEMIEDSNEKITQDEFEKNITIFEERLDAFYKFVFSYMKRKIKLSD